MRLLVLTVISFLSTIAFAESVAVSGPGGAAAVSGPGAVAVSGPGGVAAGTGQGTVAVSGFGGAAVASGSGGTVTEPGRPGFIDGYVSIAFSDSATNVGLRVGLASKYQTAFDAGKAAREKCGRDCRSITAFRNGCMALAVGEFGGNRWGMGWEPRLEEAKHRAIARCEENHERCHLRAFVCDDAEWGGHETADRAALPDGGLLLGD